MITPKTRYWGRFPSRTVKDRLRIRPTRNSPPPRVGAWVDVLLTGSSSVMRPKPRPFSVEHRGELLDIQPFLDGAEIVIGHDVDDRLIGAADRCDHIGDEGVADQAADAEADALDNAAADTDDQCRHEIDGEDTPAITLGERAAPPQALERAHAFDDADRDDDEEHGQKDETGDDEERKADGHQDAGADRRAEDRKEPAEPALDGSADIEGTAAHILKGPVDQRRLADAEDDEPDDGEGEAAEDGRAGEDLARPHGLRRADLVRAYEYRDEVRQGDHGAEQDVFREVSREDRERFAQDPADSEALAADRKIAGDGCIAHLFPPSGDGAGLIPDPRLSQLPVTVVSQPLPKSLRSGDCWQERAGGGGRCGGLTFPLGLPGFRARYISRPP